MASGGTKGRKSIVVDMRNPALNEMLRVVLDYEALLRGSTRGRVFSEMVLDCIDEEAYPDRVMAEIRDREARRLEEAGGRFGEWLESEAAG